MQAPDVIVVGGGVIGLSVAHAAARRGAQVTLVRERRQGEASEVGAGMLAPVTELHYGEEALLRLNLAAAARYPSWIAGLEEETGADAGYRPTGTLMVARDGDENAALSDLFRFRHGLGLEVARLRGSEARALEPALAPGVRGAIHAPGDHQVDGQALLGVLAAACAGAGVTVLDARAESIEITGDKARGVQLATGEHVRGGVVVIAAGCWSNAIAGLPPGLLPVRPVKGQLVRLRARRDPLPVQHVIRGADVYLVPRSDGRLVVGATVEEQGEDLRPTAGGVHYLLRDASELVPSVTELEFEQVAVGLRPGTPDNAPLLGEIGIDGLIAATGHYRNGILLAPITGDAIAALIDDGEAPPEIRAFSPLRFQRKAVPV